MVDSLDVCETVPFSTDGGASAQNGERRKKKQLWMLLMLFLYTLVNLSFSSSDRFFPLLLSFFLSFLLFFPVDLQPVFYSNCNNENITIIAKQ